jgi:hypothetical protein
LAILFSVFQQTATSLRLHLSLFVDVNAGADVAKECAITGISGHSGIIDPTISAIVSAQPVLESEVFPVIKVATVSRYAALKIVAMYSFRPAAAHLLGQ